MNKLKKNPSSRTEISDIDSQFSEFTIYMIK